VELFKGNLDNDETYLLPNESTLKFPLDQLNIKELYTIPINEEEGLSMPLHVWTFTDGFTKIIRFSDFDSI
jgi:hypothetical protein